MNEQRILDELVALLTGGGVVIRAEPLGGAGGGLCSVRGQHVFFLDTQAGSGESAALCAEAVAKVLDIESIYIRPEVRRFIEEHSGSAM
ncbi:hypothetical protein [Anaerobaca lacustris]|uniref:Uncharacterized protein n=1 Tax=Anaerobaca lacustris TaxID=3044600 RepID=A0AAW6TTB8_9BACT|nr:hypothetical protein [Sedimentisphaerales bacterium M17dextr]